MWLRYDGCKGDTAWLSFMLNTERNREGTAVVEGKGSNLEFRDYEFFVEDFDDKSITIAPAKQAPGSEEAED